MVIDGNFFFPHLFRGVWIWQMQMHMGEPQALSHNLYRCCSMRTNCFSAKDFEPNLERWLIIIFFVEQSSPSVSSWRSEKWSNIKFWSLQPQFHFKFSLAIQNLGMSSIIKVWQEILKKWHDEEIIQNDLQKKLGCPAQSRFDKKIYFYIVKKWHERIFQNHLQRARRKKWSYG